MPKTPKTRSVNQGRPTAYTEEIANQICERIATSSDGLRKICRSLKIARSSVYLWLKQHEEFSDQYARAKEMECQVLADEIIEIADTPKRGVIVTNTPKGRVVKTADMIEHRKLQIDGRKWALAKLIPKKYGERRKLTGAGGGPVRVQFINRIPLPKDSSGSSDALSGMSQMGSTPRDGGLTARQ